MDLARSDLQYATMRIYKTLVDQRENWGGRFVLLCGPGSALDGTPAAVSIAGGTTLAIDADAAAMKAAMRAGYLDFVVNSLDEALRALKNEVRQKRPLSVGLIGDVNAILTEMVERGVQPDLEVAFPSHSARDAALLKAFEAFLDRRTSASAEHGEGGASTPVAVRSRGNPAFFAASDAARLRTIDEALLAVLPAEELVRRRWVESIPRYLRDARSGGRWTWLSEEELQSLAAQGFSSGPPPSAASRES